MKNTYEQNTVKYQVVPVRTVEFVNVLDFHTIPIQNGEHDGADKRAVASTGGINQMSTDNMDGFRLIRTKHHTKPRINCHFLRLHELSTD